MEDYNINIMKTNIKDIMNKKGLTQTDLKEKTGIPQPTISDVLSQKNSHCFTVIQLVDIARALGVSTDNILGIKAESNDKTEVTLSDICTKLFDIDNMLNIQVGLCKTNNVLEVDSFTNETVVEHTYGIYFENEPLTNIIEQWGDLKNTKVSNKSTKKRIMQLWKTETKSETGERKSSWKYRNRFEQGEYLAKKLLKHLYEENSMVDFLDMYISDNLSIFKDYFDSLFIGSEQYNKNMYDEKDYYNLRRAVEYFDTHDGDGFMIIPDGIDEELPFN